MTDPATDPATGSATDPVTDPVTDPAIDPAIDPVTGRAPVTAPGGGPTQTPAQASAPAPAQASAQTPAPAPFDGLGAVPLVDEDDGVGWQSGNAVLPHELKAAAGAFPTGVTVITTRQAGAPVGMTVSSFTSVSIDPPLMLVCLARTAAALPAFRVGASMGINILARHQRDVAMAFVRPFQERFDGVAVRPGPNDIPLIEGAAAWMSGHVARIYDGGDHVILLSRVHAVHRSGEQPLLYHGGAMYDWDPQAPGAGGAS